VTRRSIAEVLERARAGLDRLPPAEAARAVADGAVLVDIRPAAQRAAEGDVGELSSRVGSGGPGSGPGRGAPYAVVIERNVLEWRFDPQSDAALPYAAYDLHVIVLCSEGYTSSLAAAALQELGVSRATDVAGGFQAWRAAGLPVTGGTSS
jgi:rhodanese-related sulfurtransferase